MAIIPIDLPAGVFKNGTKYRARGRWADSNLIRWHDGSIRAIGGWERRLVTATQAPMPRLFNPTAERARDMQAWTLNAGNAAVAFGTNSDLYYMSDTNVPVEITPLGFIGTGLNPTVSIGYGTGPYGTETYGTPRSGDGRLPDAVARWRFDTWGEDLMASAPDASIGKLYHSAGGARAAQVPNAPTGIRDFVVTDERSVMTIGAVGDPRRVSWSDREDRESWTPTVTNEAGGQTLAGVGPLVAITKVLNQILILSTTDAHVARYLGSPYVYGFQRVGEDCAPVNAAAVITTDRFAMWIGRRNFWMYDGTIKPVPCEVMDWLQDTYDTNAFSKVSGYQTSNYSELTWLFQSSGGSDVDMYVSYDYFENHWTTGRLPRTAGVDQGALRTPVMISTDGYMYNHELVGVLVPDAFAETGPLELSNGDKNMAVRYIFPDTQLPNEVNLTLYGSAMPTDQEYTYGPYPYNNPMATRAMGREIRMRADLLTSQAEVGTMRFDIAPVGTGFR